MDKFKTLLWKLEFYFCAEDGEEFGEPGGMRGPCRGGDEIAVNDRFGHGEIDVGAASLRDVGTDGGIGAALFPSNDVCGGEDLSGVTDGSDGLIGFGKMMDDFDDAWVEAKVFGSAAPGEDEGIIVFGLDLVEGGVEREIVAALFGVGLVALEIVDGGADVVAGFFAGTDGMDGVADHQQRLEGDHDFVVFDVIADQHENRFLRHRGLRNTRRITEI